MISIIIPTLNEEGTLGKTLHYLRSLACAPQQLEIIVVDGGSHDGTRSEAQACGARVVCSSKGRAVQMNEGARHAMGDILYFLHADSLPPPDFVTHITNGVRAGFHCGCFRLRFDADHWFLNANAWFTRFDIDFFRFGDQSLFVTRELFEKSGGFSETHQVMEDQHMIRRLRKLGKFIILPLPVVTSSRRYMANGIFKTQGIFILIFLLYQLGFSQRTLTRILARLTRHGA